MITVRKSRMTGHWVVKRGTERIGFRRWVDALQHAIDEAEVSRAAWKLEWQYGATGTNAMWCKACRCEVYALEETYVCSGCNRWSKD